MTVELDSSRSKEQLITQQVELVMDKTNHVGFSGTRRGMSDMQKKSVAHLVEMYSPGVFHHGSCMGADTEFHALADRALNMIVVHPPSNERTMIRSRVTFAKILTLEAKPYLDRDRDIVDASDIMIVAPLSFEEQLRSGSWTSLRYAKKTRRPIFHIEPDGAVVKFNVPDDFKIWPPKENKGWVPL